MKRIDLKNKIKSAFINNTPELRENTKEICLNTTQESPDSILLKNANKINRRLVKGIICTSLISAISLATIFVSYSSFNFNRNETNMSIYLDVNPSIQIDVNNYNRVIKCLPLNDDAKIILENLNLKGVVIETAINSIVSSLYINGYLSSDSNSILVSIDSLDNNVKLSEITNQISEIFTRNEDMDCAIIAQTVENNEELFKEAQENQISIGKMSLINKIIDVSQTYDIDDAKKLSTLSIKELNLIYSISIKDAQQNPPSEEIISGNPNGYINQNQALDLVLEKINVTKSEVRWYNIEVVAHYDSPNQRKMLYLVTVVLFDNTQRQCFYLDCVTGEFIEKTNNDEDSNNAKPRSL